MNYKMICIADLGLSLVPALNQVWNKKNLLSRNIREQKEREPKWRYLQRGV